MNVKTPTYKGFVAGWLDSSIHEILHTLPLAAESVKYVLITCLDSNRNPASLLSKSPELKPLRKEATRLEAAVLLPTKLLKEVDAKTQVLYGFDEAWFFPDRPTEASLDFESLVGPARIGDKKLKKCARWMTDHECSLALGDGEGLNFIVKAFGLVGYLLSHSMTQPPPNGRYLEPAQSVSSS